MISSLKGTPAIIADVRNKRESLETKICEAAGLYNNRYYSEVLAKGDQNSIRGYTKWMDKILCYQQQFPNAVFLPKDMFNNVSLELKLSLLPLNTFKCIDFLFSVMQQALEILKEKDKANQEAMEVLFLCCPTTCLLEHRNHSKILRSGAIVKVNDDGVLILSSW